MTELEVGQHAYIIVKIVVDPDVYLNYDSKRSDYGCPLPTMSDRVRKCAK